MSRQINKKTEDVNVSDLWYGCDDVKPRNVDWSALNIDDWHIIHPYTSEDFEKYGDPWEYSEETEEKLGYGSYDHMEESNQPMMNYYYELGERDTLDEKDARAIQDLPLCIVYFDDSDTYALALTGGGMRANLTPPFYFPLFSVCFNHL